MPRREKLLDQDALTNIIQKLINGKLRFLVQVCNCQSDRDFLAKMLAKEIMAQLGVGENARP